jgi:hypothetical protein
MNEIYVYVNIVLSFGLLSLVEGGGGGGEKGGGHGLEIKHWIKPLTPGPLVETIKMSY